MFGIKAAVTSTTGGSNSTGSGTSSTNQEPHKISAGAIAGIVLGVLVGLALLLGVALFFLSRHKKKLQQQDQQRQLDEADEKKYGAGEAGPLPPKQELGTDSGLHEMVGNAPSPPVELPAEEPAVEMYHANVSPQSGPDIFISEHDRKGSQRAAK